MLHTAIIFKSKRFKIKEEKNNDFVPGKDLAVFLLKSLLDYGFTPLHKLKEKDANFEEIIDETCYYHFELKYEIDIIEFYINLVRFDFPLQDYWTVQFNRRLSFFKTITKPNLIYSFNPKIVDTVENVIKKIGDVKDLERLTDKQYSELLIR